MNVTFKNYLFCISAVLLLLSAALYVNHWLFIPYIYAAAGAGIVVAYFATPYKGDNVRLKRLHTMEIAAGLILLVSAYFMFKEKNEWFVCLTIAAVLQLYVVFAKEWEEKKKPDD